ncbi:hypothetical protein F5Y17DRAFT_440057 [Xylariaceae sp. FL0594]|nr:hypothetical protein F5Y17DRAFT_440057 [Xylariaceae sp. FL0594]
MVRISQLTPLAAVLSGLASGASPTIRLCTDVNFGGSCIDLPLATRDYCINLTGGLSSFYHQVSSTKTPGGFICTLYRYVNKKRHEARRAFSSLSNIHVLTNR